MVGLKERAVKFMYSWTLNPDFILDSYLNPLKYARTRSVYNRSNDSKVCLKSLITQLVTVDIVQNSQSVLIFQQ